MVFAVSRDAGVDLDRHPAVDAFGGVVDGSQDVACPPDVVRRQRAESFADVDAAQREVAQLGVVAVGGRDGLLEDARVRRDADEVPVADEVAEVAGAQPVPAEVVEPDRDAGLCQRAEGIGHGRMLLLRGWIRGSASRQSGAGRSVSCRAA
jgi:hypothetical protein